MKCLMAMLVFFFCSLSLLFCQSREYSAIKSVLKATHASWKAEENYITMMSAGEQQALLGLLPEASDFTPPRERILSWTARDEEYETEHTAVRDQRKCGSCYAFGACAAYEGWKLKTESVSYDLSEQDFIMKAIWKDWGGTVKRGGCKGYSLSGSISLLKYKGVMNEKQCRYYASHYYSCPNIKPEHRINGYYFMRDIESIKQALHDYGPVYAGYAVYQDFLYYKSGYYEYKQGRLRGYHAIAIVGYDQKGWKVKNSWGRRWGENGYFRISYNQMKSRVQFAVLNGGSYVITK